MFLRQYERKLPEEVPVIAVSNNDAIFYRDELDKRLTTYLPVFIPYTHVKSLEGVGSYCLYHGNLSVAENEKAALWLLEKVFSLTNIPFVIAGKDPSNRLNRKAEKIRMYLCCNPSDAELDDLIAKAQIHVLPSFNKTGY
jgi:hypothetical protein